MLEARQVAGSLELPRPDLRGRVQGAVQAEDPQCHRLALPRHRADQHAGEHQQHRHGTAALATGERRGPEQVSGALLGQRPQGRPRLAQRLVEDVQHQPAGVLIMRGLGPHPGQP